MNRGLRAGFTSASQRDFEESDRVSASLLRSKKGHRTPLDILTLDSTSSVAVLLEKIRLSPRVSKRVKTVLGCT